MPSLVARVREVDEIRAVVRAAARTGVPFAVRGSGHGYARPGSVPDGLVLDLRLMGGTEIDPARRIGVAHAGTTAGEYTHAAAEYGLATGFGDTLTVGIPGLALGGGIGFLSRRDGLTLDNVLSADVVLADGSTVQASETRSPDLFWALRGGGGNFGVVTRMELRLSEARVVTGGLLAFEPDPRTFAALLTAASTAPGSGRALPKASPISAARTTLPTPSKRRQSLIPLHLPACPASRRWSRLCSITSTPVA